MKFQLKLKYFHSIKCVWKCHLQNGTHFAWPQCVNSLAPGDAIWHHRTRSTLLQVMACCLMAPSHHLNPQCWFVISVAFTWVQFHWKCSSHQSLNHICKPHIENYNQISWGQWVQFTRENNIQSDAVLTRFDITWYCIQHCSDCNIT